MLNCESRSQGDLSGAEVSVCSSLPELLAVGINETAELATLARQPDPDLSAAFRELDFHQFDDFRIAGSMAHILSGAQAFLDGLAWPPAVIGVILSDAADFVAPLSGLGGELSMRLEYVTDNACRKFHKDETGFRLITTYRGPGTQWIDARAAGAAPIFQMQTFEIGMLLGQRRGREGRILHRSPPIEGTGESRLVLVVDVDLLAHSE